MMRIIHVLFHGQNLANSLRLIANSYNIQNSKTPTGSKYKGTSIDNGIKMLFQRYTGSSKKFRVTDNLEDFISQYLHALIDVHIPDSVSEQ